MLALFLNDSRKAIEETEIFVLLCKYDYDAFYGYVAFTRAKEVRRSDDSSIGLFSHSWYTLEVSNVPSFERVRKKTTANGACRVLEGYHAVVVFVPAWSVPLSVADVQRQFAEYCANEHGAGNSGGEKDEGRSDDISARFQSRLRRSLLLRRIFVTQHVLLLENYFLCS